MITTPNQTTVVTKDYNQLVKETESFFANEQLSKKGFGGSVMSQSTTKEFRAVFSDGSTYTFKVEPGENAHMIAGESAREGGVKVISIDCISHPTSKA